MGGTAMPHKIGRLCERILENWHEATLYDYAFATAWILVAGFLIARFSTRTAT